MHSCGHTPSFAAVTGASGYLGSRIVAQLPRHGIDPLSMTRRLVVDHSPQSTDAIEYHPARPLACRVWERQPNVCVHVAGLAHQHGGRLEDREYFKANFTATLRLARAAKRSGCRHFVFISSVAVYGAGAAGIDESGVTMPDSAYGHSKLMGEKGLRRLADARFAVSILRLGTLFGGQDDPGNVKRLNSQLHESRFHLSGLANQKCLLHVDDAASAICCVAATNPGSEYQIYNLGGASLRMREIVASLRGGANGRRTAIAIHPTLVLGLLAPLSTALPNTKLGRLTMALRKWCNEDTVDSGLFRRRFGTPYSAPLTHQLRVAYRQPERDAA
jgi:nucleoside-diphosphate-sugar epimerase